MHNTPPALGRYAKDAIRDALDCREVADKLGWVGRKTGKGVQGQHPTIPQRTGSFTVYANGYTDFATGEKGDVFRLIALILGLDIHRDFPRILEVAAGLAGFGPGVPELHPRPRPAAPTAQADKQNPDWGRNAESFVREATRYLWSSRPDAAQVLHYLRTVRGLDDQTIKRANLGYNPTARRGQPAGITIPWTDNEGRLIAVRVRSVVGNLAAALGRPDATNRNGEALPKLLSVTGSQFGGQAYTPTGLTGRPVVIVEGEFDALIAAQGLPEHDVITAGSATGITTGWANTWGVRIATGSNIYLWLDNDAVGKEAQERLASALPQTATLHRIINPAGLKDATDVITAGHAAESLIAQAAIIDPDAYGLLPWAGLERVLVEFCAKSVPAVVRAALVIGGSFTVAELNERGIAPRTAAQILTEYTGVLFIQESAPAGRRAATYRLLPWAELSAALLDRVVLPRLIERHYRTDGDRIAPATAALLEALRADLNLLDNIRAALAPFVDQRAAQAVAADLEKVRKTLTDRTPSTLPDAVDWARDYRKAVIVKELEANGSRSTTQKAIAEKVGLDRRAVAAVYSERVAVTSNYRPLPAAAARPGEKIYDILPTVALPREVRIDPDGVVRRVQADGSTGQAVQDKTTGELVQARTIASANQAIGQAVVLRRWGGSPRLLSPEEMKAREEERKTMKLRASLRNPPQEHAPIILPGHTQAKAKPDKPTPWTGPGHDPAYAERWIRRGAALLGLDATLPLRDTVEAVAGAGAPALGT